MLCFAFQYHFCGERDGKIDTVNWFIGFWCISEFVQINDAGAGTESKNKNQRNSFAFVWMYVIKVQRNPLTQYSDSPFNLEWGAVHRHRIFIQHRNCFVFIQNENWIKLKSNSSTIFFSISLFTSSFCVCVFKSSFSLCIVFRSYCWRICFVPNQYLFIDTHLLLFASHHGPCKIKKQIKEREKRKRRNTLKIDDWAPNNEAKQKKIGDYKHTHTKKKLS